MQTEVTVVVGSTQQTVHGRLVDLSAGGASIIVAARPEVGEGVFFSFVYWGNHLCEATGQVVRTLPMGHETALAIEFAFANEALGSFLRAYERTREPLRPELLGAMTEILLRLP